jgi:hypothetical protein
VALDLLDIPEGVDFKTITGWVTLLLLKSETFGFKASND